LSEPRYIQPLLDGFTLGQAISEHCGVECYPAVRNDSEKRYIVKKISLPASQLQASALLMTGVCQDAQSVDTYYKQLAQGICEEAKILDQLSGQRGFVPYQSHQLVPMESGIGYEIHLLSRCRQSLQRRCRRGPLTHQAAMNLAIDLCAALALSREAGWLYVDLKPENIFLLGDQEYRIGDLGFLPMDALPYTSLPDRYRSLYTAPEVTDAYSSLNATLDTYALGLVLYQIYNEGRLPFSDAQDRALWLEKLAAGEPIAPPSGAEPEMAAILCRACAYSPADRWQSPAELGHALIDYMQRHGAEDTPIAPLPRKNPEPPAEEAQPEVPAEPVEDVQTPPAPQEETPADAPAEEVPEPQEQEPEPEAEPEPVPEPVQAPAPQTIIDLRPTRAELLRKFLAFFKKLLRTALILALLAAVAYGGWYGYENYYLQTIDSMTYEGSGNRVTVTVETAMDESSITVICKDTYGNAVEGELENGTVVFDRLLPSSQYIITLETEGFHKLVGPTSVTYSTPAETKILHMAAVTGQEPGSAIVSFGVEGPDSMEWTLICTAADEPERTVSFSGHSVTLTDLTVGTEYTFTLSAGSDILLSGETTMTHIAAALVQAENLALSEYADGSMVFTWSVPAGTQVDRWLVRCSSSDGYDRFQEVTDPRAVFTDITAGSTYTVEVTAAGMTLGVRTSITADSGSISDFAATLSGSSIALNWSYGGAVPEGGWKILWTVDGGAEQLLTSTENSALIPAAPGSFYSFTLLPPEGSTLRSSTCALEVPAPGRFSAYQLNADTVTVKPCAVPESPDWDYNTLLYAQEQNTFSPGGTMALLYTVTKPYTSDDSPIETLFVIRSRTGQLVSTASRTRAWNQMWDNGYCVETVSNLPTEPGQYTLTVIIAGGTLVQLPFTIG